MSYSWLLTQIFWVIRVLFKVGLLGQGYPYNARRELLFWLPISHDFESFGRRQTTCPVIEDFFLTRRLSICLGGDCIDDTGARRLDLWLGFRYHLAGGRHSANHRVGSFRLAIQPKGTEWRGSRPHVIGAGFQNIQKI